LSQDWHPWPDSHRVRLPKPCYSDGPSGTVRYRGLQWTSLKDWTRELLCIHGRNGCLEDWSPKLVSHQRLLGFNEALICLSYSGSWRTATIAHGDYWSSGVVTLHGLSLIRRALCF
jgi:hypothetical protein